MVSPNINAGSHVSDRCPLDCLLSLRDVSTRENLSSRFATRYDLIRLNSYIDKLEYGNLVLVSVYIVQRLNRR